MCVKKVVWKILLDCVVLICLALSIIIIETWVEPFQRGFFADDLSIRLPYKPQSIPEIYAILPSAIVVFTIIIIEIGRDRSSKDNAKLISGCLVPGWVWKTYTAVGVYAFGLACEHLFISATKSAVGRLRPHFYDVCMPVYNATDPLNIAGYIQGYTCAQHLAPLKEARRSFPSGHTGFSMYSAVFFIFYLQTKGKWRGSKLLRHGFQFAALLAAWYVGLTRIQEHYHYWSDVAVGGGIGAFFAAVVFIYVLKPKVSGDSEVFWGREPAPQNTLPRPVLAR